MRELAMGQMSETDGGRFFNPPFFDGFLCGVFLVAAIAITPTTSVIGRLTIYGWLIASCGNAFFG